MSPSATPRPLVPNTPKATPNGTEDTMVASNPHSKGMATTTGSKRRANSPVSRPAKAVRVALNSSAPKSHNKDRDAAAEKDGSDIDSNRPTSQELHKHLARRIHPLKRASRLHTVDHRRSPPDAAESKDTVVLDTEVLGAPSGKIFTEASPLETTSSSLSGFEEKLPATDEVASLTPPGTKEAQIKASQESRGLAVESHQPEQTLSSLPQSPKPRMAPRTKPSLFIKSKRAKKAISQPPPKSLSSHRVADVNIMNAVDAVVAEKVGRVAAKKQRGRPRPSAYFARKGGATSARLRQTDDGDLKFRKKR